MSLDCFSIGRVSLTLVNTEQSDSPSEDDSYVVLPAPCVLPDMMLCMAASLRVDCSPHPVVHFWGPFHVRVAVEWQSRWS